MSEEGKAAPQAPFDVVPKEIATEKESSESNANNEPGIPHVRELEQVYAYYGVGCSKESLWMPIIACEMLESEKSPTLVIMLRFGRGWQVIF